MKKNQVESQQTQPQQTSQVQEIVKTVILEDGTYGTEVISNKEAAQQQNTKQKISGIRYLLTQEDQIDFYLVSVIAVNLTKLIQRMPNDPKRQKLRMDCMLLFCNLLQLKSYPKSKHSISLTPVLTEPNTAERIKVCIWVLNNIEDQSFHLPIGMFCNQPESQVGTGQQIEQTGQVIRQVDDLLVMKQLRGAQAIWDADLGDEILHQTNTTENENVKIQALTGLGDPIYLEAQIEVHSFDVILEMTAINQTKSTLQNITVELATTGELKIIEKPQIVNLAQGQTAYLRASVKMQGTEEGSIFGNLTYEKHHGAPAEVISLSEVKIDVVEHINAEVINETDFRDMWAKFEWENKVKIHPVNYGELTDFAKEVSTKINMAIITPLDGSSGFLAANLYAKSKFAEDALANISIEKMNDGKIQGSIRLRAKTQGMAVCLGDHVANILKNF